jgi:hypothetical protein
VEDLVEQLSNAGCASIVDQLIAVREAEERLIAAFETADQRSEMRLHLRVVELEKLLDRLDQVVDGYGSARRRRRCSVTVLPKQESPDPHVLELRQKRLCARA